MEILADNHKMEGNRPAFLSPVVQVVRGVARRVNGFFILSIEEQSKAGIYLGAEGRDDQAGQ
jgi:hypothetical protein